MFAIACKAIVSFAAARSVTGVYSLMGKRNPIVVEYFLY
jgi:hypothetical protein